MRWDDRNVLVTGAGGFIGSHLVEELLRRKAEVTALVRYNSRNDWGMLEELYGKNDHLRVVLGDVADAGLVKTAMKDQQAVFHLAALIGIPYSYMAPESYVRTNIGGTLNVMQAALDAGVEQVVHTSTSEVYGTARYTPIDESHPLQGQSPYSATKIGADKIAESFFCSFELPVATLRPFNTFGPRQSARAVIPTIIAQALAGDMVRLGSLAPIRDLTYVADTVQAFVRIAECPAACCRVVNAGSGRGVTIGELAALIIGKINPSARIVCDDERVRPSGSEVQQLLCDNTLARELTGWRPKHALEEGLDLTIGWMREHRDAYKADRYAV